MAMHWYVVKAISGRENKARDTIVQKVRQAGLSETWLLFGARRARYRSKASRQGDH